MNPRNPFSPRQPLMQTGADVILDHFPAIRDPRQAAIGLILALSFWSGSTEALEAHLTSRGSLPPFAFAVYERASDASDACMRDPRVTFLIGKQIPYQDFVASVCVVREAGRQGPLFVSAGGSATRPKVTGERGREIAFVLVDGTPLPLDVWRWEREIGGVMTRIVLQGLADSGDVVTVVRTDGSHEDATVR
jgi:hypothetical protein